MNYYQTDKVITPNGSEIEPVTLAMVKQDLNLEDSFEANRARYSLLIRRIRSEVELAINKHIAVVAMRTEVCTHSPVIDLPCPIVKITKAEVRTPSGEWLPMDFWVVTDRSLHITSDYLDRPLRIEYTVGMPECPYNLIGDILEGVRVVSSGQPWTPPDYPDRRVNI